VGHDLTLFHDPPDITIFYIFYLIWKKYMIISKFSKSDDQLPWPTAVARPTAVHYGGLANHHGAKGGKPSHRGPWRLTA
jgi:hypothetical protein